MKLADVVAAWAREGSSLAPITDLLGIEPLEVGTGTVSVRMEARSDHHNAMGTVHGGILCDLADVAMGAALATVVEEGETFTTLDLRMSYFRAVRKGELRAEARVLRRGKSTGHVECEISGPEGEAVAKGSSTCLIRTDMP